MEHYQFVRTTRVIKLKKKKKKKKKKKEPAPSRAAYLERNAARLSNGAPLNRPKITGQWFNLLNRTRGPRGKFAKCGARTAASVKPSCKSLNADVEF